MPRAGTVQFEMNLVELISTYRHEVVTAALRRLLILGAPQELAG